MIISNSGRMLRLKEKIAVSLKKKIILENIEALIIGNPMSLDEIKKLVTKDFGNSFDDLFTKNIKVHSLTRETIMQNPYLKSVSIPNIEYNSIAYGRRIIFGGTLALYSDDKRNLETYELEKEYFIPDKNLRIPLVRGKNSSVAWMSIEPAEMNTFNSFVLESEGNVLICGCGLGYTAFMMALKPNVKSITILESNPDMIKSFNEIIYPQIPNKEKIKIIQCDANEYLEKEDLNIYDYINIDLWYDTFDMVYPYLKCLLIESKYPHTKITYWLEQTFLIRLQRELLSYICSGKFFGDESLGVLANGIISVSNDVINSKESLDSFLSFDNLKQKMRIWSAENLDKLNEFRQNTASIQDEFINNINSIVRKM